MSYKELATDPFYASVIVVLAAAALVSLYVWVSPAPALTVATGDNISVYYTGYLLNGTVFSSNAGQAPLNFTVGSGQVIPGFDNGVLGMRLNQSKVVVVPANEAYGPINPSLILSLPRGRFANQTIQPGMTVTESFNGQPYSGVVVGLNFTNVTVNFNPPLAGKTLVFNITVVGIRQ